MIQLPKNVKPEEAAAKELSRYAITAPWFDKGMQAVCATDGRIAVVLPVDAGDDDETGELPREALKAFRKATPRGVDDLNIVQENGTVSCQGVTMAREPIEGTRPDIKAVVPAKLIQTKHGTGEQVTTVVILDVKLLAKLGKAMGTDTLRLQITDESSPVRVDPGIEGSGYGVIMPVKGE